MPPKPFMRVLILLLGIFLTACASAPATPSASPTMFTGEPRSVVVDTDMGPDDWMAILYLLQRPDVRVEAITVTGTGLAHCEAGVRHALELVTLAEAGEIPIACGRETPLAGHRVFPDEWRAGSDNLQGLKLPAASYAASTQSALELLATTIESTQDVSLLTLGPLTNVAGMIQSDPDLVDKIATITIMGGAVDVPGNVAGADAEWNLYVDPQAAQIVLNSGASITFVPLDATNHAPATVAFFDRIQSQHTSPEATFVFDLLNSMYNFITSGEYFFWDPLAAAVLTDESLTPIESVRLSIDGEGNTRRTDDGATVRVALAADGSRFEQMFLDTLNAASP